MESGRAPLVSVASCGGYDAGVVRASLCAALHPLGGIERLVKPGMRVLLKPNLLAAARPELGLTTHPVVVEAVAELIQAAGGEVWIGDSPAGALERGPEVYQETGMVAAAERVAAQMVAFDRVAWTRLGARDYYMAPPVLEADLVINLPKLKTHVFTLLSGGVKNLFGTVTGNCKRDLHYEAPGVEDFSQILVDVLSLVRPGLTIVDGVCGLEGRGPGAGGTARWYRCLAASTDPVALDAVLAGAMGYQPGAVLHLRQAAQRNLGVDLLSQIRVVGDQDALDFGPLELPELHWYFAVPSWIGIPLRATARVRPEVDAAACTGCGKCAEVCPTSALTRDHPPRLDKRRCVGCFCCAEVCPQGAISPHETVTARVVKQVVQRFGVVQ